MEFSREIYWNIGHGIVLPMYLLSLVAIAVFVWGFWRRLPVYRHGKPVDRLDQIPRRILLLLRNSLGQSRVLRVLDPGALHALFFWSFGLLFIGTLLIMPRPISVPRCSALFFLKAPSTSSSPLSSTWPALLPCSCWAACWCVVSSSSPRDCRPFATITLSMPCCSPSS